MQKFPIKFFKFFTILIGIFCSNLHLDYEAKRINSIIVVLREYLELIYIATLCSMHLHYACSVTYESQC